MIDLVFPDKSVGELTYLCGIRGTILVSFRNKLKNKYHFDKFLTDTLEMIL